jgi:hypothetical protein
VGSIPIARERGGKEMALNNSLIQVGLVMQCLAASMQAWMVFHPEQTKTVGQGVVLDVVDASSQPEKSMHRSALHIFVLGAGLQIGGLLGGRRSVGGGRNPRGRRLTNEQPIKIMEGCNRGADRRGIDRLCV